MLRFSQSLKQVESTKQMSASCPIIFDRRQPETSYKQLILHARDHSLSHCFLIRESRVKGMLTVDYVLEMKSKPGQYHTKSSRLAFVNDEWINVANDDIETIEKMMSSTTTDNISERSASLYERIKEKGFDIESKNLLKPTKVESSKQAAYTSYTMVKSIPEEHSDKDLQEILDNCERMLCCGISFEEITEENYRDAVVTPNNHVYLRGYIEPWLNTKGTDPKTRRPLSVDELMPLSNIWLRLKALIERNGEGKENDLNEETSKDSSMRASL